MKKISIALVSMAALLSAAQASAISTRKTVTGLSWQINGHESSSDAERIQQALNVCTAKIQADVATASAVTGLSISYSNIAVDSTYGLWSDTEKDDWTGKRSHKAGGVVDCSYFQDIAGL